MTQTTTAHKTPECKGKFAYAGTAKTKKHIMVCHKCGAIQYV